MVKRNRELLTEGARKYAQKKAKTHRVEEIKFDKEERIGYLTGFHQRKLERQRRAQEKAKELEHQQRLEERRKIRQERREYIQEQLERVNQSIKEMYTREEDDDNVDWTLGSTVKPKKNADKDGKSSEESEELTGNSLESSGDFSESAESSDSSEWEGFSDSGNSPEPKKSILKRKEVYTVPNAEDEPEEVNVTIESLEVSNNNVVLPTYVDLSKAEEVLEKSIDRAAKYARLVNGTESKPKPKPRKFRYLTKTERKMHLTKERSRSKEKKTRGMNKGRR